MKRWLKNFVITFIARRTGFVYAGSDIDKVKRGWGFFIRIVEHPSVYDPAGLVNRFAIVAVGRRMFKFHK